ncbi:MAG: GNAT family N-acetyltransferase, partial [Chloroflexi bacterium]
HPQLSRDEIEHDVAQAPAARFSGENIILAARVGDRVVGLCWCVLFNPGSGLEAEVAEVYVDADFRSQGIGASYFVSETSPLPRCGLARATHRRCASTRRQGSGGPSSWS